MAVDMSISAEFTADSKGFTSAIKKCQDALSGFGKSLDKLSSNVSKGLKGWGVDFEKFYSTGSGVLDKFGISVDTFAAKLGTTGPVIAGITAVTVAVTKMGQEFNSAMAEIAKGTGATGDSLLEFNENLQNLMISGVGSSMADIATNIADVNTRFGSTGEELETLVDQFDQFSNVTGQNVHQAVNDVADVINKWGMETKDIKPLLDQLTKAGQDSGVSVQFLTQTLNQSKTVFTQFGMSATTSIAFVEQLAKAGVDTNTAMTGMRYALSKFSAEGKNSQKAFQEIGDSIKNAETDSEALTIALEAFGSKAGAEMINVFRNGKYSIDDFTKSLRSAGGVIEATDRATKTSKDAMAELLNTLKGMTSGFGQGFDVIFRDLLNSLQMVAGAVAPIIQPIGNAFRDIVSVVSGSAKQVISLIVEVVTEIKNVFATSDMVKSVHKALKALFGVFEDVFGLIIAILQGKWVLAWEYAKNAMLKVCDAILNALSSWLNFMKEPVNGFIKYVINPLIKAWNLVHISAKDKVEEIQPIGKIDLSGLTGLTSAITESNNKIAELTGKTTKQITGDLGTVKDVATDVATSVEKDASSSLSTVSQWEQKLIQQEIERLKREKENAVIKAENEKKSEKQIYDIKKGYDDKIIALQIQKLELDRKAALEQISDAKEIARVNQYYDNEILALKEQNIERIKEIQEQASQWETKLLAQRIALLEQEENMKIEEAKAAGKTENEIYQISKNYSVKIINLKIEQLNNQKAVDLAMATSAADRAKIIEYYEKQITYVTNQETAARKENTSKLIEEEKVADKNKYVAMLVNVANFSKQSISIVKKFSDTIVKIFSTIKKVATKAFTGIKDIAVKAFNGIKTGVKSVSGIFNKLFQFDTDSALTGLLEYEDKILSFFVLGKTKIPQFVASAVSSISNLTNQLVNIVSADDIQNAVESIINTVVSNAPQILSNIITVFSRIVEGLSTALVNSAPKIAEALSQMLTTIMANLPSIAQNILLAISTLVVSIGDELVKQAPQIEKSLTELIKVIVDNLPTILTGLVKIGATIITTIANAIVANADGIVKAIGDVVMSILQNLPTVLKAVINVILTLISGIADYINNNADAFIQAVLDIVTSIVDAVIDFIKSGGVKKLLDAIIVITKAVNKAIEENLPDIVDAIIDVLPDIVDAIITLIKEINKTSEKIMEPLMKLIVALINAILDLITDPGMIESAINVLSKLIEAIVSQLLPQLPAIIIKIILFIIQFVVQHIPQIVTAIIKGLVQGFAKTDWLGMVKSIFKAFINGIKKIFGIHSPSTLFRDFGTYMVQGLFDGLKNIWNKIKSIFENLASNIKGIFTKIFDTITSIVSKLVDGVKNAFSNMLNGVKTAVSNIGKSIASIGSGLVDGVKNTITGIGNGISSVFSTIVNSVKNAVSNIGNAIASIGSGLVDTVKNTISNIGNGISSVFSTIVSGVKNAVSNIGSAISSIGSGLVDGVKNTITGIGNAISSVFSTIVNSVKNAVSNIGNAISSIGKGLVDGVKNTITGIGNGISSVFSAIVSKVGGFVSDIGSKIASIGSSVASLGSNIWNGLTNGISSVTSTVSNTVKNMGSAVGDAVKSGFNTAIRGINSVIKKINDALSFTFPGWHLKIGGGSILGHKLPSVTIGWDDKKFSLNLPSIPELAIGTPNALRGLTLVGEKGPELVDFRGGERVYNNHNTEKMLANAGSKSNSFNIVFNNTSQTTAFTIMRELKKYNRELAFNGVL